MVRYFLARENLPINDRKAHPPLQPPEVTILSGSTYYEPDPEPKRKRKKPDLATPKEEELVAITALPEIDQVGNMSFFIDYHGRLSGPLQREDVDLIASLRRKVSRRAMLSALRNCAGSVFIGVQSFRLTNRPSTVSPRKQPYRVIS